MCLTLTFQNLITSSPVARGMAPKFGDNRTWTESCSQTIYIIYLPTYRRWRNQPPITFGGGGNNMISCRLLASASPACYWKSVIKVHVIFAPWKIRVNKSRKSHRSRETLVPTCPSKCGTCRWLERSSSPLFCKLWLISQRWRRDADNLIVTLIATAVIIAVHFLDDD